MWFKNLRAYRLTQPFTLSGNDLHDKCQPQSFTPCAASQAVSLGWVAPLGETAELLVHEAAGRLLLCMQRQERLLPSTVVRDKLNEKVADIEQEQARKVYRKERLNLKDEIVQDCLPQAFTRSIQVFAIIDKALGWIFIDTASAARAEELLNLLRDSIDTLPVVLPDVVHAPADRMTTWLARDTLPEDFILGEECELREPGEDGGVVRVRGVDLRSEEVTVHLDAGKQVSRLALEWDERLSLLLAEDLVLRRLKFSDETLKENEDIPEADPLARQDADFVLMSEALAVLYPAVLQAFGGLAE